MLPEEQARVKIDKELNNANWDVVSRDEYVPNNASAIKEALMDGNLESDYLFFIDNKAIAVLEAKREENLLGDDVKKQAIHYALHPQSWYGLWIEKKIPLVYISNGKNIYYKNLLKNPNGDFECISKMHSPKKMLQLIDKTSIYGALPILNKKGFRECQYNAEIELENSFKNGNKKALAVLATGSGKTYLACLASYRLLNYTPTKRILFLVDRNNLARQTESEFSKFDKTENQLPMSDLYRIKRLRHENDINADIVISTIQKLFAVLTGRNLTEENEDVEDESVVFDEEISNDEIIELGNNLKLSKDYFDFIIIDECHRSIYGKWRAVLDYFFDAKILGLTATPTPESYAFFNENIIQNYTYDDSIIDGVNVPSRVYRIVTSVTKHGGTIKEGSRVIETKRKDGSSYSYDANNETEYEPKELDKSVINQDQIRTVLNAYKNAIYTELYPERDKKWEYIPKTLILAMDDNHATRIVQIVKEVFSDEFNGNVPENFVQKITYSAGDSNALIRDLREDKDFRVAVTVTLVATGTDVKPLEVVFFMRDVRSSVLYTQMKGRGCRTLSDDKLKEITPNATTKECYYIIDAVGVTEHNHDIPNYRNDPKKKQTTLTLPALLEHLSHGEVSDDNLILLRNYCATIHRRYEEHPLFGKHLDYFISEFGFAPRTLANDIHDALSSGDLPEYVSPSSDNTERMELISSLIVNLYARKKLIEMQCGYSVSIIDDDKVLYAGFSKEEAKTNIENFERYINDNKDSIEALRIIYNSENSLITYRMLTELRDRLLAESKQFGIYQMWRNYKALDEKGNVDELNKKYNVNALTNLIQIVRYAYGKSSKLTSLIVGYSQRFNLYCGYNRRALTKEQIEVMRQIALYIIEDGALSSNELNSVDTDLWRKGVQCMTIPSLDNEMQILSKFLLKVA